MANSLIRGTVNPSPTTSEVEMEKDTRVMMYRAGEARVFASPEAVPAGEGWQDTPVAAEAEAAPEAPKKAKKVKAEDPPKEPEGE